MRNKMLLCSGIMNLEKIKKAIVKSAGEINTSKGSKRTADLKLSLYYVTHNLETMLIHMHEPHSSVVRVEVVMWLVFRKC